MRNEIGSILTNNYAFGGPFPKPDFAIELCMCDTHAKWYQAISEIEGIPLFCLEGIISQWETSGESKKVVQLKIDYLTNQLLEAIDWMIKTSGREFDDEKFIQGMINSIDSAVYWARTAYLNRAIPAPLDEKSMFTLYALSIINRARQEVADFYRELLDEVQDRVDNRIAASPYEKCRLISDCQPPWHALGIFRALESYGAVSVGAHYSMGLAGGWEYDKEDDTWNPTKTVKEMGIELKTREDATRALADFLIRTSSVARAVRFNGEGLNRRTMDIYNKWHAEGVIVHLNRGCEGIALGQMEMVHFLQEQGIPTLTYEGNHADPREFDEPRTLARIESFMETLGLKKIVED